MRAPEVQSAVFPTARCPACDAVVLTYVTIAEGTQTRRCVDCDADINEQLQWISAADLEGLGYQFGAPRKPPGGGCGGGCGSCSR